MSVKDMIKRSILDSAVYNQSMSLGLLMTVLKTRLQLGELPGGLMSSYVKDAQLVMEVPNELS